MVFLVAAGEDDVADFSQSHISKRTTKDGSCGYMLPRDGSVMWWFVVGRRITCLSKTNECDVTVLGDSESVVTHIKVVIVSPSESG